MNLQAAVEKASKFNARQTEYRVESAKHSAEKAVRMVANTLETITKVHALMAETTSPESVLSLLERIQKEVVELHQWSSITQLASEVKDLRKVVAIHEVFQSLDELQAAD